MEGDVVVSLFRDRGKYTIASLGGGSNDLTTLETEFAPHRGYTDYQPSCVVLSDGRVLCMYSRGTTLYQAFADSLSVFVSQDNSLSNEAAVLTDMTNPRSAVFYGDSGNLYFIVTYKYSVADGNNAKTLVYKSALKDGSDWTLFSTIQSVAWAGGGSSSLNTSYISVGVPKYYNNVWVITLPYYTQQSGSILGCTPAIYTTTDFSTFTKRFSSGRSSAYNYSYPQSRNIGELNGELWWTYYFNRASAIRDYVKSTDGLSWSVPFSYTTAGDLYSTVFSEAGTLYLFNHIDPNDNVDIYQATASPAAHEDFTDSGFNILRYNRDLVVCENADITVFLRSGGLYAVTGDNSMVVYSSGRAKTLRRIRGHYVIT